MNMPYTPDPSLTNCILYLTKIAASMGYRQTDETLTSDTDAVTVMAQYANAISKSVGQGEVDLSSIVDVSSGMSILVTLFGRVARALGQL